MPEIGAAESSSEISLVLRSDVYTIAGTTISDIPKNTTLEKFLKNLSFDSGVEISAKDGEKTLSSADIIKAA